MKPVYTTFLFLTFLLATTHCYPGARRDSSESLDDDDRKGLDTVLLVPLPRSPLSGSMFDSDFDDDSLDELSPSYFNPLMRNPFDGFLTSMQSVMNRLKQQMADILSRIPEQGVVGPWSKIPEGANTTSTTKVIDGHIVTINETTYSDDKDGEHGIVFRVRVIDVKPQNETTVDETEGETATSVTGPEEESGNVETTTPERSVETVEDFADNEIPKSQVEPLNA